MSRKILGDTILFYVMHSDVEDNWDDQWGLILAVVQLKKDKLVVTYL